MTLAQSGKRNPEAEEQNSGHGSGHQAGAEEDPAVPQADGGKGEGHGRGNTGTNVTKLFWGGQSCKAFYGRRF
jgi:hypothetical protein